MDWNRFADFTIFERYKLLIGLFTFDENTANINEDKWMKVSFDK